MSRWFMSLVLVLALALALAGCAEGVSTPEARAEASRWNRGVEAEKARAQTGFARCDAQMQAHMASCKADCDADALIAENRACSAAALAEAKSWFSEMEANR